MNLKAGENTENLEDIIFFFEREEVEYSCALEPLMVVESIENHIHIEALLGEVAFLEIVKVSSA